jgi:hypothetical protein
MLHQRHYSDISILGNYKDAVANLERMKSTGGMCSSLKTMQDKTREDILSTSRLNEHTKEMIPELEGGDERPAGWTPEKESSYQN